MADISASSEPQQDRDLALRVVPDALSAARIARRWRHARLRPQVMAYCLMSSRMALRAASEISFVRGAPQSREIPEKDSPRVLQSQARHFPITPIR